MNELRWWGGEGNIRRSHLALQKFVPSVPHSYNKSDVPLQNAGELEVNTVAKGSKTFRVGRNAKTGELTTVKEAEKHPNTHTVERMPKPGYGDTKPEKKP